MPAQPSDRPSLIARLDAALKGIGTLHTLLHRDVKSVAISHLEESDLRQMVELQLDHLGELGDLELALGAIDVQDNPDLSIERERALERLEGGREVLRQTLTRLGQLGLPLSQEAARKLTPPPPPLPVCFEGDWRVPPGAYLVGYGSCPCPNSSWKDPRTPWRGAAGTGSRWPFAYREMWPATIRWPTVFATRALRGGSSR